ncbi:hypothetical protein D3C81_190780 [compost metagenome]
MEPVESTTTILVVADSNFNNLCLDPQGYVRKLKERVAELRTGNTFLYTVSGRYGLSNVDSSLPVIEVNDRNKTLFSQTLENSSMFFDELMAISIAEEDQFIKSAREVVTSANKTFTHYKYPRKI